MKAIAAQKKFFNIVGMPSSGTSIICRFFDSIENGVCVSEPMHRLGRNSCRFNFSGMQEILLPRFDPREFLLNYKRAFIESKYLVGGLKEVSLITPTSVNRWLYVLDNVDLFDVTIFVIRDPLCNINSIMDKRASFGNPTFEDVIASYKYFLDLRKKTRKSISISYENFCEFGIPYVSSRLSGFFSILGDFKLEPKFSNNVIVSDGRAYVDDVIKIRNRKINLSESQIAEIKNTFYEGSYCFRDA